MNRVAAIVLAAGRGTRFSGGAKLLAPYRDRPLVAHVVESAKAAGLDPLLVVTGHEAPRVRDALAREPVTFVDNPAFAAGLSTSLRAGFAALPRGAEAAVVLLGDMPLVSAQDIRTLVSAWEGAGRPLAAVPVTGGRRANPVVLAAALAPAIADLTGDRGAGPLLAGLDGVLEVPLEAPALLADVDTREALDALGRSA